MASKAKIYLYKEGNECTSLTGGFSEKYNELSSRLKFEKLSNSLKLSTIPGVAPNFYGIGVLTNNKVNFSQYENIFMEHSYVIVTGHKNALALLNTVPTTQATFESSSVKIIKIDSNASDQKDKITKTFDPTELTSHYFGFSLVGYYNIDSNIQLHNVYAITKENIITINSQTSDNIIFTCNNLGLVTISQAEILINNTVVQTYTSNLDNVNYSIDKSKLLIGSNKIEVKVTYSQGDGIIETVSELLVQAYKHSALPTNAGFKAKNDRDTILYNSLVFNRDNLKSTLNSKGVDVTGVNEMSILIDKIPSIKQVVNVVASANTFQNTNISYIWYDSTNYTKASEMLCTFNGSIRISITAMKQSATSLSSAFKIVLIRSGIEQSVKYIDMPNNTEIAYEYDIPNIQSNDKIEIYVKAKASGDMTKVTFIKYKGDVV